MALELDSVVATTATLQQAAEAIARGRRGVVVVADTERRLLGTVRDRDIRRALLEGFRLESSVDDLLRSRPIPGADRILTGKAGTPPDELCAAMEAADVELLPLLDDAGRVVDVAWIDETPAENELTRALVMAGGLGTRLGELTAGVPKPMLSIGDRPLLELIVERLQAAGISRVTVATHHHADQIIRHFVDGGHFGLQIDYVNEDKPLGTAGALGLLQPSDDLLLVMNGDIVTDLDVRSLLRFHQDTGADLTVAVRRHDVEIPFGVVETVGEVVASLAEKPILQKLVNAGIYLLGPDIRRLVPRGERRDMVELIQEAIATGRKVVAFPIHEYWLDIGLIETYQQAIRDLGEGKAD